MKIKIHGEIIDAESKKIKTMFYGIGEGDVSFKDIDEALASRAEDDKRIDMSINSPGGSCLEGFAIYDAVRAQEGCIVTAEVIGECSSMASIILMAASVRRAHPNSRICIHKPRYADFYTETMTEEEAKKIYNDLHDETQRLKNIYLERTTMTEEQLESLMSEDRYITAEQALEYGVITEIIQPMTAKKEDKTKQHSYKMKLQALRDFAKKIGFKMEPVAMTLNTEDGSTIEIEREEGEPAKGDAVLSDTPNGEYKMADGTTIVIADSVITEIRPAEQTEEEEATKEQMEEALAKAGERIDALTAENESLKSQVADLTSQLTASKANEKTADDIKTLQLVANAGGLKWLESLKSNHKPAEREIKTAKKEVSSISEILAAKKEEIKNKNKNKKQ
jgi:ATP-dependent Clp protease protease subunit